MAKSKKTEEPDVVLTSRDGIRIVFWTKVGPQGQIDDMEFAGQLRDAIADSGVSQYQLSKVAEVPQGAISNFLAGKDIRLQTFNRLASVMGFTLKQQRSKAPRVGRPKLGK